MYQLFKCNRTDAPCNKGKLVGQKLLLKLLKIWAIRASLQIEDRLRELALFNLAIDAKLRASDLVGLRVSDVEAGGRVSSRIIILKRKTGRPVQFEISLRTRQAVEDWISDSQLTASGYLLPSRIHSSMHLSTRPYARIVETWVNGIGNDTALYASHSLRRTKASMISRQTRNLRAVQILLGHAKLESTVRYLGIEIDDALEPAEQTEA